MGILGLNFTMGDNIDRGKLISAKDIHREGIGGMGEQIGCAPRTKGGETGTQRESPLL